jgi:ATP-dependent helicase HrpB
VDPRSLPIWEIHQGILDTLRSGNRLVLVAPTGSGKTTQVPQMLLDAGIADGATPGKPTPDPSQEGSGARSSEIASPASARESSSDSSLPKSLPLPGGARGGSSGGRKRIVVLQPRRVAARTVATRVAWERKVKLGAEVGYQVRFDDRIADDTRICFVTEGILLRWLQDDPTLADVGVLLFDEFHERNLLSDVALALAKHLQQTARPDLKLVVMSATLEAEPVARYLDDAPVLVSEGKMYPVGVVWLDYGDRRPASDQAADVVERIVNSGEPGDILVFMPGMGEINSTINALRAARMSEPCEFIPLHGELQPEQQDLAFAPCDRRKIIVATNVAETSVTIDGIIHVVDSGLARVARYDAERGIGTLAIEEISRASAEQRKGRAGRTAPGTCHRLWTESGHLNRPAKNTPEIQRADLAEVVLLLHSLGIKRAKEFDWLDKPDPQSVERAEELLHTLGAIDLKSEQLTPIGRQMLRLPMHPRYSRMLVEAAKHGCVPAAALCAALVSGRDLLLRVGREDQRAKEARELFEASQDSDFYTLIRAYQFAKNNHFSPHSCQRAGVNAKVAREVEQTFEQFLEIARREKLIVEESDQPLVGGDQSKAGVPRSESRAPRSDDPLPKCIVAGFVDQLARRRDKGTLECDLAGGRSGTLMRESVVQNSDLLAIATIREVETALRPLTLLGLATAVKREWLEEMFADQLDTTVEHLYDRAHKRLAAIRLVRFHGLIVAHEHQREVEPDAAGRCLAEAYAKGWFELPNFGHELKQFVARVNLICTAMPDLGLARFDDAAVTAALARAFRGLTLAKEAQAAPLKDAFRAHLPEGQSGWVDELAPLHIPWPGGKPVKLAYSEEVTEREAVSPEAQVKLLDCFELKDHPFVCEGAVPVKLWLCTPDGKRLEATCDWPDWRAKHYPKLKSALAKKFPGFTWR